ncbi:MAG TPA: alkaline phosphatase family protein [Acidimicrobiales bacterium]|nr:alkaline phosphatase family protein [Acidimicrobiales bacterium]
MTTAGIQTRLDEASGAWRLRRRWKGAGANILPDPSMPPGTDRIPEVRHIILLMMENHSFDNYLGRLGRGEGLTGHLPVNRTSEGRPIPAHRFSRTDQDPVSPSQSWRSSHIQYAEGRNDGFARAVEDMAPDTDPALGMGHWGEEDLPFYYDLARTFPLADRWFSSCLGPTFPNRRFLIAATANGLIDDALASIIDHPRTGTIFDLLNRYRVSWVNYHHVPPLQLWRGQAGARGRRVAALTLGSFLTGVDYRAKGHVRCTANVYPLSVARTVSHLRHIERFFKDAASGRLPAVSIVDPDFDTCSEENPQDIQMGESFAADVIDAVMHGPAWEHTVLLWFYDEHGGYFDHVPPPPAVPPDDVLPHSLAEGKGALKWVARHLLRRSSLPHQDDAHGAYDRYGFRVPAVLISPRARPDFVTSTVFDHTSVLRMIEEKWNLPSLTRRDASATAPWEMLDLERPPHFAAPPTMSAPARPGVWRRYQQSGRRGLRHGGPTNGAA